MSTYQQRLAQVQWLMQGLRVPSSEILLPALLRFNLTNWMEHRREAKRHEKHRLSMVQILAARDETLVESNQEGMSLRERLDQVVQLLETIRAQSPDSLVFVSVPDQQVQVRIPAAYLEDLSAALMISMSHRMKDHHQ